MKKTIISTLLLIGLMSSTSAFAFDFHQLVKSKAEDAKWWVNIAAGRGIADKREKWLSDRPVSGTITFNGAVSDKYFVTFSRYHITGNWLDIMDTGVLAGVKWNNDYGYVGLSAGVAYASSVVYGGWSSRDYITSGAVVPVEAQLFWTPFKHLGIGITTHAGVGKFNYGSAHLGFQVYT